MDERAEVVGTTESLPLGTTTTEEGTTVVALAVSEEADSVVAGAVVEAVVPAVVPAEVVVAEESD